VRSLPLSRRGSPLAAGLTAFCLCLALLAASARAAGDDTDKLPVPRFVSIGTDRANVRTGPGERYPIDWVFVKKNVPVKVVAEYGRWRKIEDADGALGWVYGALLSGRRYAVVIGGQHTIYAEPDASAAPVFFADTGVMAKLERCHRDWCEIEAKGYKGWIPKTQMWGALPAEEFE